jgi:hypothetical protein
MYPVIPAELSASVVQLAVAFVALVGTVLGFLFTARA